MHEFPHHYAVAAKAQPEGSIDLASPGLDNIESAAPAEFGGPGDLWSPETLLVAAVADCFILSFRAVARASRMEWLSISCEVDGVLERPEKVTLFTAFHLRVILEVEQGIDPDKAKRILDKAEHTCLITNSLSASSHLDAEVRVAS